MSTKPMKMTGKCGRQSFVAHVDHNGEEWVILVNHGDGTQSVRYRSTIAARPDNGALYVSQLVRREFNITGTFNTYGAKS